MSKSVRRAPPRVLTIAGSDSSGGAGIQADLKTFAAHGVYGMSVITAQNTVEVSAVHEIPVDVVTAQIDAVLGDIPAQAVKIGMLSSVTIVRAVAARLRVHRPPVIILDPVMISKSGAALLADDAVAALVEELLPITTLVTPNLPEAERLSGRRLGPRPDSDALAEAAAVLRRGSGEPPPAILIKGGHAEGETVSDILFDADGKSTFRHPRLDTTSTHGTGCTLSSAIAARMARGESLHQAVGGAADYLHGAIRAAYPIGRGHGPVDHLYRITESA